MSLKQIAATITGASERTLERVCSEENWVALRDEAWREVGSVKRDLALRDIDAIQTSHLQMAQAARGIAARGLSQLRDAQLTASDVVSILKFATNLERETLGMNTQKVQLSGKVSITSLADLVNNEPFDDE
jgi:hypothetical protein